MSPNKEKCILLSRYLCKLRTHCMKNINMYVNSSVLDGSLQVLGQKNKKAFAILTNDSPANWRKNYRIGTRIRRKT